LIPTFSQPSVRITDIPTIQAHVSAGGPELDHADADCRNPSTSPAPIGLGVARWARAGVAHRAGKVLLERQIGIVWHGDRLQSRAAQAFIEIAVQISLDVDMPTVPSLSSTG
jgi:hypothetical protein